MAYQLADTHDNAAGLATVSPQPACPGLLWKKRITTADQTVLHNGFPYTRWVYSLLTPEAYAALLSTFGLTTALYNDVTVSTIGEDRTTFYTYNARILKPEMEQDVRWRTGFYRDATFYLVRMIAI